MPNKQGVCMYEYLMQEGKTDSTAQSRVSPRSWLHLIRSPWIWSQPSVAANKFKEAYINRRKELSVPRLVTHRYSGLFLFPMVSCFQVSN